MTKIINSKKIIPFIFCVCLFLISCKQRELHVIYGQTKPNKTFYCNEDLATQIDTNNFKKMPLFDQMIVVDRENGSGGTIDYADTTLMCDSWNRWGTGISNIYRTFFALPELESLPSCAKITKANLWIHSYPKPNEYVENPTDTLQILLTCWPKDSIEKIQWTYFPTYFTNTLSSSITPFQHDSWICFELTAVVQNIVQKKYNNGIFMLKTSNENMFIPATRQKNFYGPQNKNLAFRPYLEITF